MGLLPSHPSPPPSVPQSAAWTVRPLWTISGATAWLRRHPDDILRMIEDGRLEWAWDIAAGPCKRRREIRIWFESLTGGQKIGQNCGVFENRTTVAQLPVRPTKAMGFPQTITILGQKVKIYGKSPGYPHYRIAYKEGGKRKLVTFQTYAAALQAAKEACRRMARGQAVLTGEMAKQALLAFEALKSIEMQSKRRIGLVSVILQYGEILKILGDANPVEAARWYATTMATVKRIAISKAVEEFQQEREPLAQSKNGKRPQLSPQYHYLIGNWLRHFAEALPSYSVCDLSRETLDTYFKSKSDAAPKTRNLIRGALSVFFNWCSSKDYLPKHHRLGEAASMKMEAVMRDEIKFYSPEDFKKLLQAAPADILPIVALCGFAGLRLQEVLRLIWEDVWRVEGHVEIGAKIAKTRSRRLVEICPALASWLEPYKGRTGPICSLSVQHYHAKFRTVCKAAGIKKIPNGLRHSFCTFHYALYSDENKTAAQAGNSPGVIHQHYRGLATKEQAEAWFNVFPGREQ